MSPTRVMTRCALILTAAITTTGGCSLLLQPDDGSFPDGDADADSDADADADSDADADTDADADADADTDADADSDADADGNVDADADGDADADTDEPVDDCPFGCDDGIECTVDRCVIDTCEHTQDDDLCTDGLVCDIDEGCSNVIYVNCDCEPDAMCGEGTAARPFASIEEAGLHVIATTNNDGTRTVIRVAEGLCTGIGFEYAEENAPLVVAGDPRATPGAPLTRWINVESDRAIKGSGFAEITIRDLYLDHEKRGVELTGDSTCSLFNVVIDDHSEHGIKAKDRASFTMRNSVVRRSAKTGIYAEGSGTARVENSLVIHNGGSEAGGLYVKGDVALTVVNTTIADNVAGDEPAAIWVASTITAEIRSVVLWNNVGTTAETCLGCSLSTDSLDGTVPPLFVGTEERFEPPDYRLLPGSPGRDLATRTRWHPQIDFWGTWRSGLIDAGFHEILP